LNSHLAGIAVLEVARSMTTSLPLACEIGAARTNELTSTFEPVFELQAKLRLLVPPSPRQFDHRRFTPVPA
jgi:hypothetical protein